MISFERANTGDYKKHMGWTGSSSAIDVITGVWAAASGFHIRSGGLGFVPVEKDFPPVLVTLAVIYPSQELLLLDILC